MTLASLTPSPLLPLVLVLVPLLPVSAYASKEACQPDWSRAAPIVAEQRLATVEEMSRIASARGGDTIVRAILCEEGGRWHYRLVLKDKHGHLRTQKVDATRPFER